MLHQHIILEACRLSSRSCFPRFRFRPKIQVGCFLVFVDIRYLHVRVRKWVICDGTRPRFVLYLIYGRGLAS